MQGLKGGKEETNLLQVRRGLEIMKNWRGLEILED